MENPWKSIKDELPREWPEKVDLWLRIYASPKSMGMSDSFRVPEAWRKGHSWFHYRENGKEDELDGVYVTHWMMMPPEPTK